MAALHLLCSVLSDASPIHRSNVNHTTYMYFLTIAGETFKFFQDLYSRYFYSLHLYLDIFFGLYLNILRCVVKHVMC